MLEIGVAIVAIGLLSLLAVRPMKHYLRRLDFDVSARNIQRLMQAAQSRAMADPNVHIGVYFDLTGKPQRAFLFKDLAHPGRYQYEGAADPPYLQPETLKRGLSFRKLNGYPPEIVFRGDGSAYKSMKIILTDGILEDTLDVLASTGRVRVGR